MITRRENIIRAAALLDEARNLLSNSDLPAEPQHDWVRLDELTDQADLLVAEARALVTRAARLAKPDPVKP